jgi:predicted ABC-type ATPase
MIVPDLLNFLTSGSDKKTVLVVLAGPNGAGKTTFFELFIAPSGLPFVNADFIAKELAEKGKPVSDDEAARLAEQKRQEYVSEKRSFCMETVFSDAAGTKRTFFKDAQAKGYVVLLIFIGLNHVETSRSRVAQRVSAGGHNVPDRKIDGRFPRTFGNLQKALQFVDRAFLFDNSSFAEPYRPVAMYVAGEPHQLFPPLPSWAHFILPKPLIRKK